MDMSQYLEIFMEESKEHLQHMNSILLDLEKDSSDLNLLNEIFRIAHTIKGMSGTMGFNKVAGLTHEMENVLHLVRSREIEVTGGIIDVLFECFDTLESYISSLESTGQEGSTNSDALVAKLAGIVKNKGVQVGASDVQQASEVTGTSVVEVAAEPGVQGDADDFRLELDGTYKGVINSAINQGLNVLKVRVTVTANCMLKSARAFIVFNTFEQFGEVIKSYPIAEEIEDEKFDSFFEVLFVSKLDARTIENEIMKISEIESVYAFEVTAEEVKALEQRDNEPKVVLEPEAIQQQSTTQSQGQAATAPQAVASATPAVREMKGKDDEKESKTDKQKTSKTVRVDIDRLDNLMNLVSELIIIKTRLEDQGSNNRENMSDAIEYLERITTSLHDAVMKVRMVPVERTFNRFPRMVRDLSKDLGKGIKLLMSGEETEVDRTVIDEIGDPLIHLIRNSIDHGIESPETRMSKGKPDYGTVHLRAYPDGNTVVIEVEDDGNGIDPDRVLSKAISKGLVTDREAEGMNHNDIINLLFRPGFSTAEKITDLSGRGVGLDVVKTKIESLNGTVEVRSTLGKGSKFTIRLPLTLAIIQALMVNLGVEKYALPLNNIKEITTIPAKSICMVQDQEVVLYRNKTLPLLRLGSILQVKDMVEAKEDLVVVVVRKGDTEAGLIVDSLIGQQEIVIKSLGKYLTGVKVIAGATILGNGGVALIVDPNQLF